jgi:hypothetical protein
LCKIFKFVGNGFPGPCPPPPPFFFLETALSF